VKKSGFSRPITVALLLTTGLFLTAAFVVAAFFVTSQSLFNRGVMPGTPIRWNGLPVPVTTLTQWASFSYAGQVNDLVQIDGLLWAATDGGVVVWDVAGEPGRAVKFTVDHGLGANRLTSIAVGRDGSIWAGGVAGLSHYDGREWRIFRAADGLSSDMVHDLAVDRDGNVWVATDNGLDRYDGRGWRTYSDRGFLAPLPGSTVTSLAIDPTNRLWVGTSQGLARYDGQWRSFFVTDGLPDNRIESLAVDPAGELWIATAAGLTRHNGRDWDTFRPNMPADVALDPAPRLIVPAGDGSVYVGYEDRQTPLIRFDPLTGRSSPVVTVSGDPLPSIPATILIGNEGSLWIGTSDGVYQFNGTFFAHWRAPSELPAATIHDLLYARDSLWVSSTDGIARYDGIWHYFGPDEGLVDGETSALAIDDHGLIWTALQTPQAGLLRLNPAGDMWERVVCPVEAPAGLDINAAVQGPDGSLWFATELGVSRFDGLTWRAYGAREGLSSDSVDALVVDAMGTLWTGTPGGLYHFEDPQWQLVDPTPISRLATGPDGSLWAMSGVRIYRAGVAGLTPIPELPITTAIRGMAATTEALWLATADGVLFYDGNAWTVHTMAEGLPALDVTAIATIGEQVWVSTSGDAQEVEIVTYDGQNWRSHPNRMPTAETLLSNIIRDIQVTPDGKLWLATPSGINRLSDGGWRSYTTANGLPGADVRKLAWTFDTLWAATNLGLARFNGQSWESFGTTAHDQPGAGVSSLAVGPDGELWVALDEGWPNVLRVFDGQGWQVVPLRSADSHVRQMAVAPGGRLISHVIDAGRSYLGVYDGLEWTWQTQDQLPLQIGQMAVDPAGRLWVIGQDNLTDSPEAVVAVLEITSEGVGNVLARYTGSETGLNPVINFVTDNNFSHPFYFAPDERVYVGIAGAVLVFDSSQVGAYQLIDTWPIPLPFTRHTFSLAADPGGNIWAGTERGIAIVDGDDGPSALAEVRSFYAPPKTPPWWSSVRTMTLRPDGGILLGTAAGGIGIYTGRDFDGVLHPSQGPRAWARALYPIDAVLTAGSGDLWVGSEGGGVARFSGSTWDVLAPDPALVAPVSELAISGGQAWIGTNAGLVIVNDLDDLQCRFEDIEGGIAITGALRDEQGVLWASTLDSGVRRAQEDHIRQRELGSAPVPALAAAANGDVWFANGHQPWLTRFRQASAEGGEEWSRLPINSTLIIPQEITSLAVSPNQDIWIGSMSGLVRFSGGSWLGLTTREGLADNHVQDLLASVDGSMWVVTPGGISRYNP
jgi:ligand-binding sensor domain-containing protein